MKRHLIGVAVAALGLGLCPVSAAEEPEKYPIWWSPSLELESLVKIDKRLRQPYWPHAEGLRIYKEGDGNYLKVAIANDCVSLLRLSDEGYYAVEHLGWDIQLFRAARCRAIRMLKSAKPAGTSYLRDFELTPDAIDYLPAMVNIGPGCARFCRYLAANKNRIPLSAFEKVLDTKLGDTTWWAGGNDFPVALLTVWTAGWRVDVDIAARADFSGDGVDDILVLVDSAALGGRPAGSNLFLLTRERAGAVLHVLDGDHYRWVEDTHLKICTDFPCETKDAPQ